MATSVEMLSGRRKKDYAAESAVEGLEAAASATALGEDAEASDSEAAAAAEEPIAEELAA